MNILLTGQVLWTYDKEIIKPSLKDELRALFFGAPPVYKHQGDIVLTNYSINITGDTNLIINFSSMTELYMGFDETYLRSYVRLGGVYWQPLRIKYQDLSTEKIVYLIIDYGYWKTNNNVWFEALKEVV